jgi:hypothetical protein
MSDVTTYRFVVCIDIHANSLKEAYRELYNKMAVSGFDWESSDEAYNDEGEEISVDELSETRMEVIAEETEEKR